MKSTAEEKDASASSRSVTLGQYRVIAKLGTGGMAEVYLAVAQGAMNVNRLVVVKRLREEHANDPDSREMFLNEARLAARLNHPNVIQTFEAGSESGNYFLAMEYVEGQPFSRVLTKLKEHERRLEPKMAARIVADALNGLHYAHELTDFDGTPLDIVHRDVSPQNMMLTYGGVTKIVDFGIAKAAGSKQTAHGVFKGKVAFMAPEQVVGENVDGRADVFAAGIVLWEALTGKHLMAADTPAKTLYNLMNKVIPRVSEERPDVPAALDDIVARSLERDLVKRWPTAKAMRDALEAFIATNGGFSTEEVGELVSSLFADRKKTVQQQVKAQLAALSLSRTSDPDLHAISKTHVRATSNATVIDLSEGGMGGSHPSIFRVVTTGSGTLAQDGVAPAPRTSRLAIGGLIGVTVLALGVSGLALHRAQMSAAQAKAREEAPRVEAPPPPVSVVTVTVPAPIVSAPPTPTAHAAAPVVTAAHAPFVAPAAKPASFGTPNKPSTPNAPSAPTAEKPTEPSRPAPTATTQPTAAPTETAQGRTFRREL